MKALDGIDLAIQRGEVHALLGENGAGKSTLVKIMCGIYQPDEGDIFIDGEQRRFNNYRRAIEAGVGIIFQEFSLIPYMSAIDNIFLNREIRNRWGLLDRRAMRRKAEAIFKRLTVAIDLDCPVEQLSVAQQQFVEIAKALSLEARVLVLDEPTATLTPGEAEHLFSVMNDLRLLGVGMVFISHHGRDFHHLRSHHRTARRRLHRNAGYRRHQRGRAGAVDGRAQNRERLPGETAPGRYRDGAAGGGDPARNTA